MAVDGSVGGAVVSLVDFLAFGCAVAVSVLVVASVVALTVVGLTAWLVSGLWWLL